MGYIEPYNCRQLQAQWESLQAQLEQVETEIAALEAEVRWGRRQAAPFPRVSQSQ
jgi:cell division protein FtsB